MITTRHIAVALAAVLCLSLGFAGAALSAPTPLQIAAEGPQSGSQATNGLDQLRGVQLAVKQQNARGGLWDKRKVQVFAADDKGDSVNAKATALGVLARGIHFLIGPYNSSVGAVNLPIYRRNRVLPVWMTSLDSTAGFGVTVQPMNTQIAPIEARYIKRVRARRVAMLVDDTSNGAFTRGMAQRLRRKLRRQGRSVSWISIKEGRKGGYYAKQVARALRKRPDLVYVSTYFPEGTKVAKALKARGRGPRCLMGLANVDTGFLAHTRLGQARRCVFSGVPAAPQMRSATTYVRQYRSAFGKNPGVWGSFTYDSAQILFRAINAARSLDPAAVERQLRRLKGFRGATGPITISPRTGYRTNVPVSILRVNRHRKFVVTK